ncbi:MAG: hypothetical protein HY996_00055 [Micrococcales bacterium]|nr:hypothetical protein [Micrococcales bacterium]
MIDCHAHLADAVFDADRVQVLARAAAVGVRAIVVNLTFARDFIARAHGVTPERVDLVTTENARRLFAS